MREESGENRSDRRRLEHRLTCAVQGRPSASSNRATFRGRATSFLISRCDEFILFDDVQYTKRDWRNRNLIKMEGGVRWLSIPVHVGGRYFQAIKDVTISDKGWNTKHWKTIATSYAQAPHLSGVQRSI